MIVVMVGNENRIHIFDGRPRADDLSDDASPGVESAKLWMLKLWRRGVIRYIVLAFGCNI